MLWETWEGTDHMKFSTSIGSDDPNWIVLANLISLPQSWEVLDMKWELLHLLGQYFLVESILHSILSFKTKHYSIR